MEATQRPSAFEFVSNEAHVFETSWYLLAAAKRQDDIESRRPQCVNRVADQRSAIELDRRLVPADTKAMAAGEYRSDDAVSSHDVTALLLTNSRC